MLRRTRTFAQKLFQPKTNGGAPFLALAFLCWQRGIRGCLEWSVLGGITKSLGDADADAGCCHLKWFSEGTPGGSERFLLRHNLNSVQADF